MKLHHKRLTIHTIRLTLWFIIIVNIIRVSISGNCMTVYIDLDQQTVILKAMRNQNGL